ncbi:phage protein Gp27 family protein [Faecalispora anaeroviscerum]|uniref:phage protein Gp27 family protein n=1 Tax=Faecalispora anaeroviscerum TaxID=2991836 RepID=UPI0024B9952C|nr:phage protein Gp27 family protein [Faecalispora anaeroviscerum]
MGRKRNRSSGKIDALPDNLKSIVEQMLLSGQSYREIVEYLSQNNVSVSQMSVCRYAGKYLASVEMLKMSQENMKMMMEEMDKYPNLDATEAILRVASQNVFNAISSVDQDAWENMEPDKLLKEASSLIRAAGYKRRVDLQNKTDTEAALDASQALLADVLAKKHPELYKQVMDVLKQEKEKQSAEG